jgi:hypothetical protein
MPGDRHWRLRTWLHGALIAAAAATGAQRPDAQSEAPAVVERLYAYLDAYEPVLSEFVADEAFR